MPHSKREDFHTLPAHVVFRLVHDLPSLRTPTVVREIERTFAAGRERPGFRLVHWGIQRNSVHLIVEAHDHDALYRALMGVGCRLGRSVNRALGRRGRVIGDRYKVQLLRTPRAVRDALQAVLLYPGRHTGTADSNRATLDPASSARWFDGWKPGSRSAVDVAAADERPVATPRTRLLASAWRRYGLLDPGDDGPPETEKRRRV